MDLFKKRSNQSVNYLSGQSVPFRVQFKTNADENASSNNADKAKANEQNGAPGGIVGFMLSYAQIAC